MLVCQKPGLFFGKRCNPGDALPSREKWDASSLQSNINQGMVVEDNSPYPEEEATKEPKKKAPNKKRGA